MIRIPIRDEQIEPPDDDADHDRRVYITEMSAMQRVIVELRADTASTVANLKAENWRLIAEKAARDAPPSVWRALKPAAADAGVEYETTRSWCELGVIVAQKRIGRWFVQMDSLYAHVAALRGK
jgi:hypothetical protein